MASDTVKRFKTILDWVIFPGYEFEVRKGHGGIFMRGQHTAYDMVAQKERPQQTRKWLLSPEATESEVVQTAFKCILTSQEHETREAFKYKGQAILSPHYDVNDLVGICRQGNSAAGARKESE